MNAFQYYWKIGNSKNISYLTIVLKRIYILNTSFIFIIFVRSHREMIKAKRIDCLVQRIKL
jgi:hypothetical protein